MKIYIVPSAGLLQVSVIKRIAYNLFDTVGSVLLAAEEKDRLHCSEVCR